MDKSKTLKTSLGQDRRPPLEALPTQSPKSSRENKQGKHRPRATPTKAQHSPSQSMSRSRQSETKGHRFVVDPPKPITAISNKQQQVTKNDNNSVGKSTLGAIASMQQDSKASKSHASGSLVAALPPETVSARSATASNTDISDLHHPSFFEAGDSEFELMHVKVTVLGLTGIMSEKTTKNNSVPVISSKYLRSPPPPIKDGGSSSEETTQSNLGFGSQDTNTFSDKEKNPTTAVLSYRRNVSNSQTSIASHLPSLPLGMPASSFGFANRYMASWPASSVIPFIGEKDIAEQSTFTLLRVMMREQYNPDDTRAGTNISGFVHETIDLHINLARGGELIPLGIATLVISGDEEGQVTMSVPAKSVQVKKGKRVVLDENSKKVRRPKLFKKAPARPYFHSDPERTFHLDENATLRFSLQCIPHGTMKAAEASEARRVILMQRGLERMKEENSVMDRCKADRRARRQAKLRELAERGPATPKPIPIPDRAEQVPTSTSNFGFLCVSQYCGNLVNDEGEYSLDDIAIEKLLARENDLAVDGGTIDKYFRNQLGISYSVSSSDVSSVSASASSSEFESEEDETATRHLNRKITIAHRH